MKVVEESCLSTDEYHVEKLFAIEQYWEDQALFVMAKPRPTSALLYVCSCTLLYTLPDGRTLQAKPGDVVYLPQSSRYETRFCGADKSRTGTMLVEFVTLQDEPFVWADTVQILTGHSGMKADFEEMIRAYHSPMPSPARQRSVLYRMLEAIGQRARRMRTRNFASIAPGIAYLETDLSQQKSIAEIAAMCHVSPSCFRRLFQQYAGLSPMQFQMGVRIAHARRLLQSGTMTVCEISDALHFADPSYFCRIFKKHTGMTPAAYAGQFAQPLADVVR